MPPPRCWRLEVLAWQRVVRREHATLVPGLHPTAQAKSVG